MSGIDPNSADFENKKAALIAKLSDQLAWLPNIESLPAFHDVLSEYLLGHAPNAFNYAAALGHPFSQSEAELAVVNLVLHLFELRMRWNCHQARVHIGVDWDRHWTQTKIDWQAKQVRLAELLKEAGDLFVSGQCDSGLAPSLAKYKLQDQSNGLGDVDSVYWCGAENLRRWAESVERTPVEAVFPLAQQHPSSWRLGKFGKRGRASDPDSAIRAMVIRSIADYIPDKMLRGNGYSVICDLAAFIGIEGLTRQNVRGILQGGRT